MSTQLAMTTTLLNILFTEAQLHYLIYFATTQLIPIQFVLKNNSYVASQHILSSTIMEASYVFTISAAEAQLLLYSKYFAVIHNNPSKRLASIEHNNIPVVTQLSLSSVVITKGIAYIALRTSIIISSNILVYILIVSLMSSYPRVIDLHHHNFISLLTTLKRFTNKFNGFLMSVRISFNTFSFVSQHLWFNNNISLTHKLVSSRAMPTVILLKPRTSSSKPFHKSIVYHANASLSTCSSQFIFIIIWILNGPVFSLRGEVFHWALFSNISFPLLLNTHFITPPSSQQSQLYESSTIRSLILSISIVQPLNITEQLYQYSADNSVYKLDYIMVSSFLLTIFINTTLSTVNRISNCGYNIAKIYPNNICDSAQDVSAYLYCLYSLLGSTNAIYSCTVRAFTRNNYSSFTKETILYHAIIMATCSQWHKYRQHHLMSYRLSSCIPSLCTC
mmetsp:Transcript_20595/g.28480  ORF Transcript_20595/g.28480 Transcript_20595/m.28480 type:complete len:448 (-) Transcript_20595:393-1736(-)